MDSQCLDDYYEHNKGVSHTFYTTHGNLKEVQLCYYGWTDMAIISLETSGKYYLKIRNQYVMLEEDYSNPNGNHSKINLTHLKTWYETEKILNHIGDELIFVDSSAAISCLKPEENVTQEDINKCTIAFPKNVEIVHLECLD